MFFYQIFLILLLYTGFECAPCKVRTFGEGNIVCVCDEVYCDELVLLSNVSQNQAAFYETSQEGARFSSSVLNFSSSSAEETPVLTVNKSQMYQFILGFGGAFTDATGINIKSVSAALQKHILSSYFSEYGLEYNMGRIPIASCDFSTHVYSYDDFRDDLSLTNFSLTKEDFTFKIPFIKLAMELSKEELLLFGSPWSAPGWMKTNDAMNGQGTLKGEPGQKYYKAWANYLIRFLESYRDNNITLWGLTLQNEPTDGCLVAFAFQSMCFPPEKQRDFLKLDLGPSLKEAGFVPDNLKVMIVDDARVVLPRWADVILEDADAAQYVSGIAFHWYYEDITPHSLVNITHWRHPGLFFLPTEACTGSYPWEFPKVALGNWDRAERYAHDIMQDLLNWSVGWIDWNLVLDMQGGPNWVKNYVDAPIIVNVGQNEFYKQPMYYALAQFSKCLPRGSYRIDLDTPPSISNLGNKFHVAAFQTPKDNVVVISVNRMDEPVNVALYDSSKGFLNITVTPHSIQSYVW